MPIEPVNPSKKTGGDGQEKYPAKPKHGPGKFDADLEKAKIAQKARDDVSKTISGTFGGITDLMERKAKPYNKAKGGVIKSASKRADGIAIRGRTKA